MALFGVRRKKENQNQSEKLSSSASHSRDTLNHSSHLPSNSVGLNNNNYTNNETNNLKSSTSSSPHLNHNSKSSINHSKSNHNNSLKSKSKSNLTRDNSNHGHPHQDRDQERQNDKFHHHLSTPNPANHHHNINSNLSNNNNSFKNSATNSFQPSSNSILQLHHQHQAHSHLSHQPTSNHLPSNSSRNPLLQSLPPSSSSPQPSTPLPPSSHPPPPPQPSSIPSSLNQPNLSNSSHSTNSTIIYPWSHRKLGLLPPAPFPGDPPNLSNSFYLKPSPLPFPRYGHSINPMGTSSGSGDIYIFAGLVKDQVKNDLYVLNISPPNQSSITSHSLNQILTVGLVETRGEIPLPRVGHASVGVGNVLIVWGGDTKSSDDDPQDDGLYLLNLSTREWTRVKVSGPCPEGRYGHSVAIIGSKFFIFGGQTDNGRFMNDLWSFDLHKLKSGSPKWQLIDIPPSASIPAPRTGHTLVTYSDSIYIFGGTDGQYHYNDTWHYDPSTGNWRELDCIGYIPLPREGHAATLVDDVMYVLGGRGIDGKDLDDLAAFKISNQRWYMFQNMGPAPVGRSGHSMASWQGKVYVLGGESYTSPRSDDPSIVHVLDTAKIKYPLDPSTSTSRPLPTKQSSNASLNNSNRPNSTFPPPSQPPNPPTSSANINNQNDSSAHDRNSKRPITASPTELAARTRRLDELANVNHRRTIGSLSPRSSTIPNQYLANQTNNSSRRSMSSSASSHDRIASVDNVPVLNTTSGPKPPRPNPPDRQLISKSMSTINSNSSPSNLQPVKSSSSGSPPPAAVNPRRISAEISRIINGNNIAPSQSPANSISSQPNLDPPLKTQQHPQPQRQQQPSPPPPQQQQQQPQQPSQQQQQQQQSSSETVVQYHNHIQADLSQNLQKKNGWMRALLVMAIKQGFHIPTTPLVEEENDFIADERSWLMSFQEPSLNSKMDKGIPRLIEALLHLKQELASAKTQIAKQTKSSDDVCIEANKTKTAALQEASFYRVKLAALEASSVSEINKLDRERIGDLEHKLSEAFLLKSGLERQVTQLTNQLEQERSLKELSQDNLTKANQQSKQLEALHSRAIMDYEELLKRTENLELSTIESIEKYETLNLTHNSLTSELEACRTKLQTAESSNQNYLSTLESLQKTLAATNTRADELQNFWDQTKQELKSQKNSTLELNQELELRQQEIVDLRSKFQELQQILGTLQDENAALKNLNQSGLHELVSNARLLKNVNESVESSDGHARKKGSDEPTSLMMVRDHSKARLETTITELNEARSRNLALEKELVISKSELGVMRSKVANLVEECNKIKAQFSAKELETKEKTKLLETAEMKASLMKSLMVENGMLGGGDEDLVNRSFESALGSGSLTGLTALFPTSLGGGSVIDHNHSFDQLMKKVQELETQLDERTRAHSELENQHEEAQKEMQVAEDKYREAHRKHEAAADEIASLVEEVQRLRSGGASSVSPASAEGNGKVEEELQALQERHRSLEQTHVKAVQYVKGTEKMLRRMREELSKYKEKTESLESELNNIKKTGAVSSLGGGQNGDNQLINGTNQDSKMAIEMRQQLVELTAQLEKLRSSSRQSNLQNDELQKRMSSLQAEYEKDMANYERASSQELRMMKTELGEMEAHNEKLRHELMKLNIENQKLNEKMIEQGDKGQSYLNTTEGNGNKSDGMKDGDEEDVRNSILNAHKQMDWMKKENIELQNRCRDAEAKIALLLDHMENRSENHRRSSGLDSIDSDFSSYGANSSIFQHQLTSTSSKSNPTANNNQRSIYQHPQQKQHFGNGHDDEHDAQEVVVQKQSSTLES
ncbi:hypothetical protein O181_033437 [Austropuccinia psidii MF-1]|uniref:Negative regulator of mitotic exit n=1 Tax=Austropuccinia psidii MF-1 TaxID=1389203 RepID=A0A9Q3H765_9BASI|nr:hypothetical protein [Austropuccinia psidii MF-1]